MNDAVKRGDVWIVNLDPIIGHEIAKKRPCFILSENESNFALKTVTILPISTGTSRLPSLYVYLPKIYELKENSHIIIQQIRTVSKLRLLKKIGEIKDNKIFDEIKWRLDQYLGFN